MPYPKVAKASRRLLKTPTHFMAIPLEKTP
jgi:hypothetical protein